MVSGVGDQVWGKKYEIKNRGVHAPMHMCLHCEKQDLNKPRKKSLDSPVNQLPGQSTSYTISQLY